MNKFYLSMIALAAAFSLGAFAQPSAGKRTGTVDELRACMSTQDDIEARQKTIRETGAQLVKAGESLNAQNKEMVEEGQRALEDPAASGRRTRYERKERALRLEVEAHRKAEETFNADRAKIETDFNAFREKCADRAYLQDDIEKVKKEREAGGKK